MPDDHERAFQNDFKQLMLMFEAFHKLMPEKPMVEILQIIAGLITPKSRDENRNV